MDAPIWPKGEDSAIELMGYQLSERESPILLTHIPLLDQLKWRKLAGDLLSAPYSDTPVIHEARVLLWLRGAIDYGEISTLNAAPNFGLLHEAMSIGIRSNAFPSVCDAYDRLLNGKVSLSFNERLDLCFKYVRLLKRRGRFTKALKLLGSTSVELVETCSIRDRKLYEARILLSAAKALGSHQSRLEQSLLLARLAFRRTEKIMSIQSDTRSVQNTWLRSIDAVSRFNFELRTRLGDTNDLTSSSHLFKQWNLAAECDEALGNQPSRVTFARLAALEQTSKTVHVQNRYRKHFFNELVRLSAGPMDMRGLTVRHTQYARIVLRSDLYEDANRHVDIALNYAELVCDWQSISRALLLKSEILVASKQFDQNHVQRLLDRGKRTLEKLDEPPLELLLSYTKDQARQYLMIGETEAAILAIEEALAYVRTLRKALHEEQYFLRHTRGKSRTPKSFLWHLQLQAFLSERERARMRSSLGGDWELLSHSQDTLIDNLKTANQISKHHSNVVQPARRASSLKRAIYHTMKNVVGKAFGELNDDISCEKGNLINQASAQNAIYTARARLLELVGTVLQDELTAEKTETDWHDIVQLITPSQEYLKILTFFDPEIQVKIIVENSFEIQAEPESFRVYFFNFLMNAAQQTSTMAGNAPHVIEISVRWDSNNHTGGIDVIDPAGRLNQLTEGINAAKSRVSYLSGRQRGLRFVIAFLDEMWNCQVSTSGVEGFESKVIISFRGSARVRSL